MPLPSFIAPCIILATLAGIAVGRYPGLRMNRATIALVGATALLVVRAMTLEQAYEGIDLNTIMLLLGVMILNANLAIAGFFRLVCARVAHWARSPRQLLALVVVSSGVLSAVFLNDTVVLMFTPLVLEITAALRRNPVPYLVGLATAANIGSAATITGNPQNIIIGIASGIPYVTFTAYQLPVAAIGLAVAWAVIVLVYRQEFVRGRFEARARVDVDIYAPLLRKSLIAAALMLAALVAGAPIPLAAFGAASLLLVTRRLKPERVFAEIDWSLLVFFTGLFVVTHAIETTGLTDKLFSFVQPLTHGGVASLSIVAVVLSNLVSNVPAVLLFKPLVPQLGDPQRVWLVLAMATTFAGNLTLLGSVANLIVAESARARGVHLSFLEYLKAGVPVTILTVAMGAAWFSLIP
ncbi:anion transporter [bacterium]|nr:anion transporter [bacterium]